MKNFFKWAKPIIFYKHCAQVVLLSKKNFKQFFFIKKSILTVIKREYFEFKGLKDKVVYFDFLKKDGVCTHTLHRHAADVINDSPAALQVESQFVAQLDQVFSCPTSCIYHWLFQLIISERRATAMYQRNPLK